MVFSSIIFIYVFLPIFFVFYFGVSALFRLFDRKKGGEGRRQSICILSENVILLLFSLFFYYWGEPSFIVIMLLSITINYLGGILVDDSVIKVKVARRIFLGVTIALNLSLLAYYKYYDFLIDCINALLGSHFELKGIALPIGISFFTFQGMSYVIDVYRNGVKMQKNPFYVALYVSMFPQLVAGPIVRFSDIEQEMKHRMPDINMIRLGLNRFVKGLFKKVVIANTLAVPADNIFSIQPDQMLCSTAWLGALLYTLQIYYDFSGYSDMAIGLGKILGFSFPENFKLPYVSKSVTDFWRRWHISLGTWFRDYLYIPLGGNRKGNVYLNLIIVFFLTGLWHGASMNFIVWGLWHGLFLLIERIFFRKIVKNKSPMSLVLVFRQVYTMMVVMIGWVLFRSDNLNYAFNYLRVMLMGTTGSNVLFETSYFVNNFCGFIIIIAIFFSLGTKELLYKMVGSKRIMGKNVFSDMCLILGFIISSMLLMSESYNPFIYFRF